MSSPTWTQTRTSLVLALSIATAAAFTRTSKKQDLFQGIEQIAGPLAEIWPEFKPDIEEQTNEFKESTLEKIRTLVDMIIFNRMADTLESIWPELRSEIEEKKNSYKRSRGSSQDKFKALMDLAICNKTDNIGKGNVAIALVPRRRQDNSESILLIENSQGGRDIDYWTMSLNYTTSLYEQRSREAYNVMDCSDDNPVNVEHELVCKFDTQLLGSHCTAHNYWGYTSKSPCIIVEMQKIVNWEPDVYKSTGELPYHMPEDLKDHIYEQKKERGRIPKMLWLNCAGSTPFDDENVGEIEYYPWRGFPAYYFPYAYIGNDDWQAPMVAVKFNTPAKNVLINVECRVYAKNIDHLRDDSPDSVYGVMNFELLI